MNTTIATGVCQQRRGIKMLEGWIRQHMRKYFWQRWHNRRGKQLKTKPYHLSQASGSVGTWRLARSPILQTVLNNARLRQWGLLVPSDFATIRVAGFNRRMRKTA
ncbi:MAG: hypothetical protein HOP23_14950 [Methylococcaceae bacterium]|nr:hypothetical protein [Methylococcaceae bacterium]